MRLNFLGKMPTAWALLLACAGVLLLLEAPTATTAQLTDLDNEEQTNQDLTDKPERKKKPLVVKDVHVSCNSDDITLTISTLVESFNGLIYPKGLSKNSTCMSEYISEEGDLVYVLPLRSCNTMATDVVDGIEYFNTIVVQPHRKLVTNQGRGYHIRCRYKTEEKTLKSDFDVNGLGTTPLTATAAMPGSSMRIYRGEPVDNLVAEEVRIGDPLTLVVTIDAQDIYGMHISDCVVKDGLGWNEQALINDDGCPIDGEIMGEFEYSSSKTTALVHFQAHKFPYTPSVYYQCNVRLCIKHAGGCDDVPPICDAHGVNTLKRRKKRQTIELDERGVLYDEARDDVTVKVHTGMYVHEASDLDPSSGFIDDTADEISRVHDPSRICFPQRDFAIAIAVAGLILIIIVILVILCVLSRRRRRKDLSTTGSSIYSGPYTNTAYSSHSS